MNTYTIMSIATFCEARARGIDFQKSMIVSVAGQAAAFFQKHGALIEGNKTKITDKQFVGMASFSVVGGALKICPKNVPAKDTEPDVRFSHLNKGKSSTIETENLSAKAPDASKDFTHTEEFEVSAQFSQEKEFQLKSSR